MAQTVDQIIFYLSGGISNTEPSRALGGEMSTAVVLDGINNLFGDLTVAQSIAGRIDHRCFYVYNNSSDSFANVEVYISEQIEGGSSGYLGITTADDQQQLTFLTSSNITGGSFQFWVGDDGPVTVNYENTMEAWAGNFEAALTNLDYSATVVGSFFPDYSTGYYQNKKAYVFIVTFNENSGSKAQPYITITKNDLITTGDMVSRVIKSVAGSPINNVAKKITNATTIPEGVIFQETSPADTILIGYLSPQEFFPVWVKRISPASSESVQGDGFTVSIRANAVIF